MISPLRRVVCVIQKPIGFFDGSLRGFKKSRKCLFDFNRRLLAVVYVIAAGSGVGRFSSRGSLHIGRVALDFAGIDLFRRIRDKLGTVRTEYGHRVALAVGIIHLACPHGQKAFDLALNGRLGILGLESAVVLDGHQFMHRPCQGRVNLVDSVLKFIKSDIHLITRGGKISADYRRLLCRVARNADDVFLIFHRLLEKAVGRPLRHRHDRGYRFFDFVKLPLPQGKFSVALLHGIEPQLELIFFGSGRVNLVLQRLVGHLCRGQAVFQLGYLARNGADRFRQRGAVTGNGGAFLLKGALGIFPVAAFFLQILDFAAQFLVFLYFLVHLT